MAAPPPTGFGLAKKIDAKEKAINLDPKETEVRELWKKSADGLAAELRGRRGKRQSPQDGDAEQPHHRKGSSGLSRWVASSISK